VAEGPPPSANAGAVERTHEYGDGANCWAGSVVVEVAGVVVVDAVTGGGR
jgi:hypothetical protein